MKNVPELRFKEFSGEWKEEKFGQLFSFVSTNSFSREKLNYNAGKVKNIHYGDIHTKFRSLFDIRKENVPFINEEILDKKINDDTFCKEGDLIIADASEDYEAIGKTIELINLNCEKIIAGLHTIMARPINNNMAIGFAGYLMQYKNVRYQIKMIAQGIKVLSISVKRLKEIYLNIPSLPEQQKIASFLSAIDKKIELTDKRLEYLESYKKGLMQKLLTGEIRFPGFNDEWKEEKLGDLLTEIKKEKIENQQLYKVANIQLYGKGMKHTNKTPNITEKGRPYFIINEGDILIGKQAFHCGSIAIATKDFQNCVTSNAILHTIENSQKLIKDFIVLYLKNESFYNSLKNISEGTGQKEIAKNEFNNIKINIPSLPEQQKIASFLSAIDKKIELTKSRLENLKTYKKGLLQKMFV
ncbi:MAG: restriction endonuclease subunit S [Deltaproteobacteria bacterium]|nr:restriction endonuclease subunit S [Deltaproteobacteria bacterium]